MEDRNKFSIIHPLMLSSLHISVASPSLMSCFLSCISSASIHVSFVSFDSSLRFADVLCPWVFIFITSLHHISSLFLPLLCVFPLHFVIVIADPSIFTRYGRGVRSFNLPNKLTALFSPVMCVCETYMLFSLFLFI